MNWHTIQFGILFGLVDALVLPIVKNVSSHKWNSLWMLIPSLVYAINPFIFLKALSAETMTIMNVVWDLVSVITVTLIGVFVYGEQIAPVKRIGVVLSFVSLFLMTYEGNGVVGVADVFKW
jgi:multidrug transporter EmrE-like cation transporter